MTLLAESVLVLNKHFLATQVCTVKDAITLTYKGAAKIVDQDYRQYTFEEWIEFSVTNQTDPVYQQRISSPSMSIIVPHVIVLIHHESIPLVARTIKYSRKNIFVRDNNTCMYCGYKFRKEQLTLDHVIPRCLGGPNSYTNVVTACKHCNSTKGGRTPEQAGMRLLSQPKTPRWKSHIGMPFSKSKQDYWKKFLV